MLCKRIIATSVTENTNKEQRLENGSLNLIAYEVIRSIDGDISRIQNGDILDITI